MNGILIIDKPAGLTSHDVVARARRILRERRIGHTGTLDPFATGVLVLLVGQATRLAQFFAGADKEYKALIRLGFATDTGDLEGAALSSPDEQPSFDWSDEEIRGAFTQLTGDILQRPPMYSAKKRDGKKLYELARRGEEVARDPLPVTVHTFEALEPGVRIVGDGTAHLRVRVVCSAGTYVRTLAEDFGRLLQIGAHLTELRRVRAGQFQLRDALTLEELDEAVSQKLLETKLISPATALSTMSFLHLSNGEARRARNGMAMLVSESSWSEGEKVRLLDNEGNLIGIGAFDAQHQMVHPRVVLALEGQ